MSHLFVVGVTVVHHEKAGREKRADFSHMNAEEKCQHHLGKERSQVEERKAVFHGQKSDDPARIQQSLKPGFITAGGPLAAVELYYAEVRWD